MLDYQYIPLGDPTSDLRLVRIYAGAQEEDLECGIFTFKDYPWFIPPYQALSYVWGDTTRRVPISVDGKRLFVTANLESALRNLRCLTPDMARSQLPLWIDAMCIDQQNPEERDQQVRRMRAIYQRAVRVVIWLGNYYEPSDYEPSDWVRSTIERRGIMGQNQGTSELVSRAWELAALLAMNPSTVSPEVYDCLLNTDNWFQLARIFQRPWFERLWVIQELAVSEKAVALCGRFEVEWKYIEKAAAWIVRPESAQIMFVEHILPLMGAHRVIQVSLQSMADVDTQNILTVLYSTQAAKCSDPRDRLYAILGVVEDTADVDIDYSIPVHEVYRNWASRRIRRTNTLDVLNACADSSRSGDLPSWVPDLRRPWGQDRALWKLSAGKDSPLGMLLQPLGRDPPDVENYMDFQFSEDGLRLQVAGHQLCRITSLSSVGDAVTNLGNPIELTNRLKEIVTTWENWFETTARSSRHYRGAGLSGFRIALLRNLHWMLGDANDYLENFEVWRGERTNLTRCVVDGTVDKSKQDVELKQFERQLFPRVHGCRMFVAKGGEGEGRGENEIGAVAGNIHVQEGDEVWFLAGVVTPIVLRWDPSCNGHRVISPCFISARMVEAAKFGPGPSQTIVDLI